MIRIILSILLASLPLWSHHIDPPCDQQFKQRPLISITVTSPQANVAWIKNHSYTITWNKFGQMPNTVRILLSDPAVTTLVRVIADPAPNTGSFQWTIPGNLAPGRYKILVRASNTQISDLSEEFRIVDELKVKPVDMRKRQVIVTKPQEGRKYTPGDVIPIEWETDMHKAIENTNNMLYFDIHVCDRNGAAKIFTIVERKEWNTYYAGGNRYSMRWVWNPYEGNKAITTGQYRIKVTAKLADRDPFGMPGVSGRINISRGVENLTEELSPQIRDRRSTRTTAYRGDGKTETNMLTQEAFRGQFDSKPGKARAGFAFYKASYGGSIVVGFDWKFIGNIYRTQMVFPVEQHRKPGRMLLKATLRLTVEENALSARRTEITGYPQAQTCGRKLYYLTSPWSGRCLSTPGYQIATLTDQQVVTWDVTQYVQNWFTGSEPNHGFLLGSVVDAFTDSSDGFVLEGAADQINCVTWYKPVLILEFLEGKD